MCIRDSRAGETDGENYYFLTNEQFEEKIDRGEMLEYVNYCGKYYGTPKSEVDARLDRGTTVVLVIEVVGAANIKKMCIRDSPCGDRRTGADSAGNDHP